MWVVILIHRRGVQGDSKDWWGESWLILPERRWMVVINWPRNYLWPILLLLVIPSLFWVLFWISWAGGFSMVFWFLFWIWNHLSCAFWVVFWISVSVIMSRLLKILCCELNRSWVNNWGWCLYPSWNCGKGAFRACTHNFISNSWNSSCTFSLLLCRAF